MDKKKIGIVVCPGHDSTIVAEAIAVASINHDVTILTPRDDSFAVKGKRYTNKPEHRHSNRIVRSLISNYFRTEFTNDDDWVIIDEYRLIQDKKSNLSKSRRDTIEREFNRRFQETK